MPLELEHGAIRAALQLCALALGEGLKLLDESGFSITGVTTDDDQTELTFEQCRFELLIKVSRHIGGLANLIQTTGACIGNLALAVKRQQIRDKGIGVRFGWLKTQFRHCFSASSDFTCG